MYIRLFREKVEMLNVYREAHLGHLFLNYSLHVEGQECVILI